MSAAEAASVPPVARRLARGTRLLLAGRRRYARRLLAATAALAAVFCFLGLGSHGVRMWDETRYAENAYQMLQTHDFINYVYDGVPDDWVAKPPLGIWAIALSYKLFGFNEEALRVPSALAGVAIIVLTFLIVRLYRGPLSAAFACFLLITCRGIIGTHVARTGDLDGVYLATAMGMIYFMARYVDRAERRALLASAACAGLCFYTKGFMLLMILPGLGLFVILRGRARALLTERYFWLGVALFAACLGSWYVAIKVYGQTFAGSSLGHDAWETMTTYDIWRRFTEKIEGDNTTAAFTLSALDTRFGPWIYLFYLSAVVAAVKGRGRLAALRQAVGKDGLTCLAVAIAASTVLILTNSQTKFNWYYSIAVPFLAILTMVTFRRAAREVRLLWALLPPLAVCALGMQVYSSFHQEHTLTDDIIAEEGLIAGADHIYYTPELPTFNAVLALKWRRRHLEPLPPTLAAAAAEPLTPRISRLAAGDGYSLLLAVKP